MEQPVTEIQAPSTATQPSDVINEIPADPSSAAPVEVPVDPSAATTSEVPAVPVEESAAGETSAVAPEATGEAPVEPAVVPAPADEVAPAEALPPVEIEVPEVTVPAPAAQ